MRRRMKRWILGNTDNSNCSPQESAASASSQLLSFLPPDKSTRFPAVEFTVRRRPSKGRRIRSNGRLAALQGVGAPGDGEPWWRAERPPRPPSKASIRLRPPPRTSELQTKLQFEKPRQGPAPSNRPEPGTAAQTAPRRELLLRHAQRPPQPRSARA